MFARSILSVLWALFLIGTAPAQEKDFADYSRVLRVWGVDQGLLGGRVDCVEQTPDGYLWAGTQEGLFRSKGKTFTLIDTGKPEVKNQEGISHMQVDRDGALWMRRADGKLIHSFQNQVTVIDHAPTISHLFRANPHPRGGIVAVSKTNIASTILHITADRTTPICPPLKENITTAYVTPDDRVWLGVADNALAELKDGELVFQPTDLTRGTHRFLSLPDGSVLSLGKTGICKWHQSSWQEYQSFPTPLRDFAHFFIRDHDGRIWFGGRTSERFVLEPDGQINAIRTGRNALPGVIQDLALDTEGDLWFASFSGLFQARYMPFVTWKTPHELSTDRVVALAPASDGSVWFSGFGGICHLPPGHFEPDFVLPYTNSDFAICNSDNEGNLWIIRGRGKLRYLRKGENQETPVDYGPHRINHTCMAVDQQGVSWLSTYTGLFFCDPNKAPLTLESASGSNGLPAGRAYYILAKNNGDLLTIIANQGVYTRPSGEVAWQRVSPPDDEIAKVTGIVDKDQQGRFWGAALGTNTISCWQNGSSFSVDLESLGIQDVRITGLTVDEEGHLWLSTRNAGVAAMQCDELLAAMSDPSVSPTISWFDSLSGLGSKGLSFTDQSMRKGSDGRIWVATNGGLSAIRPRLWQQEIDRASLQEVTIESCSADGQSVSPVDQVHIPPGTSQIGIRYGVPSFGFPGEISYRYRLIGASEKWSDSSEGITTFQELSPGDYQFEVMASNRFGVWNPLPATLSFTVLPHWWQRSDVQFIIGILVILLAWLLIRMRINSLKTRSSLQEEFSRQLISSQEDERKRIAHELHDGLGQSLLVVKNLAAMGQHSHSEDSSAATQFTSIAGSASDALEEVRSISRALRPPELDRLGLTEAIHATLDRITESSGIPVNSQVDNLDGVLVPEHEIGVFRILQETLSNIVKHAEAKTITITASLAEKEFRLSVKDDGNGFDLDTKQSGVGLQSIHERALLMGGRWEVQSSPGKGTTTNLSIPIPDSN